LFKAPQPGAERISLPLILTFSLPTIPLSAMGLAMSVSLAPYLASHLGLSLSAVGLAFMIVRFIDMGVDVGLGAAMDRTHTRLGRYRLWMLLSAPVLVAGCWLLFMAPVGIRFGYLVTSLVVYYFGASIINLSHPAWAARLATHYNARSNLFGIQAAIGVVGAFAVLVVAIGAHAFGLKDTDVVPAMGWFVIATLPVSILIACVATPERITPDDPAHRVRPKDYLDLLLKPDLLRLILAQTALTLGPGWMSALYLFFFKDVLGFNQADEYILLGIYILAGIIGAPTAAWVSKRVSKHRTLMMTTTAYSLGLCSILVLPHGKFWLTVPVMVWCGFMASGFDLMIRAMLADVGDEVRLEQGRERISLIYAMNGLASKIAIALQLFLAYRILEWLGYSAKDGAHNTVQAIQNLQAVYIIGPIFFVMLGGACVIGWRMHEKRHSEIRAALEERDARLSGEAGQAAGSPAATLPENSIATAAG
jgi:GPH family glycoside/pentoside/hexuronide:cation symporter